jgi:NitT/TauT family transport system substrate-binding protein
MFLHRKHSSAHRHGRPGRVRTNRVRAPFLLECRSIHLHGFRMNKRLLLQSFLAASALSFGLTPAFAQAPTPIKFQLDWRFEGPAALFLHPAAKGYFKAAGLDVTIDAGNGSGGTVTRVASGAYEMGFADLAALMEFHANNPDSPNKPVAVMMVYNNTPASVMALKKSGITKPADLAGKKLGAPVFDAGRRAFPIFAKANNIGAVNWTAMDPTLRETMLMRGDIDAITGFTFTSLLNLEARGAKAADVVVLPYPDYGVKLYGNVIIASPKLIKENPAGGEEIPLGLRQGRQGSHRQPGDGHRIGEGARRHHRQQAGNPPPATGHRHRDQQRRRARRRLRRRQRGPHVADGLAGVRRLQHQDPREPRCRVDGRAAAAGGRTQRNPAQVMAGAPSDAAAPSSTSRTSGSPTTRSCCARTTSRSRPST